jgi:very-short-patch-repair endonuclease
MTRYRRVVNTHAMPGGPAGSSAASWPTVTTTNLPYLSMLADTGTVLRREAIEAGLSPGEIDHLVDRGVCVRVRRGAYASSEQWTTMHAEQRHTVTSNAVTRSLGEPAVLGHVSAALVHGMPVWGVDLSAVHVVRGTRGHGSRREAGVVHHAAQLPAEHVTEVGGLLLTTAARTLVDLARTVGFESAVVTTDYALNAGLTTPQEILDVATWQSDWPGSRAAGRVRRFANGSAESVAESRGRVRMREAGLPEPELQVEIYDELERFVGRGDFVFPRQQTIAECDGRRKYRAANAEKAIEDVVWEEKRREDALRALGWEVVRFTWADLERSPRWLRRMILSAFKRAAGRPAPAGFMRTTS